MKKQLIIDGTLTKYSITEQGEIYGIRGAPLKIGDKGTVQLRVNGKNKTYSVAHLVATTFLPYNPEQTMVIHLDGNYLNNCIDNLKWISKEENSLNTWEKRRKNGTTGAGSVKGPRPKRENIVDLKELESKLKTNEKVVIIEDVVTNYAISNSGILRNLNTGYILKGNKKSGYIYYCLRYNGGQKNISAHRLVALMFLEPQPGCDIVDHIDGNRENNNVKNLRWVTCRENTVNIHLDTPYSTKGKANYSLSLKDEQGEIWRQYQETPLYVSNLGRVKNISSHKVLKGVLRLDGYHEIKSTLIKQQRILTHRLVWEAFYGEIEDGFVINHINGIKNDNRLGNLEKVSFQENLIKASLETNAWNFKRVGVYDGLGEQVITYANASEAARAIGILPSSMRNSIRRGGKCYDGLTYQYLDE